MKIENYVFSFNVTCGQGIAPTPQKTKRQKAIYTDFDMGIYYFAMKTVCRAPKHGDSLNVTSGSSVQKAAYITSKSLTNDRTGETHNFQHGRQKKIASTIDLGITFSDGKKIFTTEKNRHNAYSRFWSKVEQEEKRRDARTARSIILALPYELDNEKNKNLVQAYTEYLAQTYGCAIHAAIHLDDQKNPHCHLLMTTRTANPDGTFGEKIRILDTPKTAHFELEKMRETWMKLNNNFLAPYNVTLDHRSYKRQGIDKKGQAHQGPAQTHIRKKEIKNLEEKIENQKKETKKMENATLKPTTKKPAPPRATQKKTETPPQPVMPPEKAQALYRHHHGAAAKIKKGKSPREIAELTALRIHACGHSIQEAMQIMKDDPDMNAALMAAYSTGSAAKLEKLAPHAAQMKIQEKQTLAGTQTQKQEQKTWQQRQAEHISATQRM